MVFADRLRQLREDRGLSQSALARATGLRQSHISAWESGIRQPLPDGLMKLADYFCCSIDYLLCYGPENQDKRKIDETIAELNSLSKDDQLKVAGYIDCLKKKK